MLTQTWVRYSNQRSLNARYYAVILGAIFTLLFSLFWLGTYSQVTLNALAHQKLGEKFDLSSHRLESLQSILNSTLGFQQILAINLPSRVDHRDGLILAAAVSNISLEFVDGVDGKTIDKKVLPSVLGDHVLEYPGALGAWRAHMNAISRAVKNGWQSTLIVEDDVDWDVRIHQQLQAFALGSDFVARHFDEGIRTSAQLSHSNVPRSSPYGDNWDVLWFGHCGMVIDNHATAMMFERDDTAPLAKYVYSWDKMEKKILAEYPPHSRIVTQESSGICSIAYAVSQAGARKILFELGLQKLDAAFDLMLRNFCEGNSGRSKNKCITVLPQIMDQYRPAGFISGDSDVEESETKGTVREKAFSYNIRHSVRLNMAKLLTGDTNYDDQYPDSPTL